MPYELGRHSTNELRGVHPKLILVVQHAIQVTLQDFTVHDGLRTTEEQNEYVRTGVSWTMKSKHLVQPDGYGHAVDLVPYINGRLRWEWEPIYKIMSAMQHAATCEGVHLLWGGDWKQLNGTAGDAEYRVQAYVSERRRLGLNARPDGPHYQLIGPDSPSLRQAA